MITGYIQNTERMNNSGIVARINHSQAIVGRISVPYGEYKLDSDHEIITIDRYLLHDQVISPISENAIVSMTSNETSTNIISPVNSLSSSEIQTETYILTPVEGNFEEDIEL